MAASTVAFNKVIPAEHRLKQLKVASVISTWPKNTSVDKFEPCNKATAVACVYPIEDSLSSTAKAISTKFTPLKTPAVLATQILKAKLIFGILPVKMIQKVVGEFIRSISIGSSNMIGSLKAPWVF